jgi:hypothetical protein
VDVQAFPIDDDTVAMINTPKDALTGTLKEQHPIGPIVWEQTQYEQDAYYCENSLIVTNIIDYANNLSPITSSSGEATEEYMSEYMVKEKASLKQAVSGLLAALDEILVHPSKAKDTGQAIQTGKHLAQRTVNSFSGNHQWSMPLMSSALLGNKSIFTSDFFCYVFPHANISYVNSLYITNLDSKTNQNEHTCNVDDPGHTPS